MTSGPMYSLSNPPQMTFDERMDEIHEQAAREGYDLLIVAGKNGKARTSVVGSAVGVAAATLSAVEHNDGDNALYRVMKMYKTLEDAKQEVPLWAKIFIALQVGGLILLTLINFK